MLRTVARILTITVLSTGCVDSSDPLVAIVPRADITTFAQVSFDAVVKGPMTKPVGCSAGVTVCGNASISGFGSAVFTYTITAFAKVSPSCGVYDATVTFALRDASTLSLGESGTVCGPGGSFFPQPAPGGSYGNPIDGTGSWTVTGATGQFNGYTGSGTDSFRSAGASLTATYSGLLQN